MMGARATAAVAFAIAGTVASAQIPTFRLVVSPGNDARLGSASSPRPRRLLQAVLGNGPARPVGDAEGNGFAVAHDEEVWILTALHVVYRAETIQVEQVTCASGLHVMPVAALKAGTEILIWPEYELAAFKLEPEVVGGAKTHERLRTAAARLDAADAGALSSSALLRLDATSSRNPCPRGDATFLGTLSVSQLADHIASRDRSAPHRDELRGSMSPTVRLVLHHSYAAPGASGGPMTSSTDRRAVVAVHIAGYESPSLGWAVSLVNDPGPGDAAPRREVLDWTRATRVLLGAEPWPAYRPPWLAQSVELVPADRRAWVRHHARARAFGLEWASDFGGADHPYAPDTLRHTLRLTFSAEPWAFPAREPWGSVRFRVGGGWRWATVEDQLVVGEEVVKKSSFGANGPVVDARGEVVLRRLARARLALGAGSRLWVPLRLRADEQRPDWVLGLPVLSARVLIDAFGPVALSLEGTFSLERTKVLSQRFTGIDPELTAATGRRWGRTFGLGVGVEL